MKPCKIVTLYIPEESFEDWDLFKKLAPVIEKKKDPSLKVKNPNKVIAYVFRNFFKLYVQKYKEALYKKNAPNNFEDKKEGIETNQESNNTQVQE